MNGRGSGLSGLRRAGPDDLVPLVALQHAAYSRNRDILGVEPIPLQADYRRVLADQEVWLAEDAQGLAGALIVEPRPDDLLIWSIATDPARQHSGVGRALLSAAEERARQLGLHAVRLYTGQLLTANVAWYTRNGYAVERLEELPDRRIVHMMKSI